VRVVPNLYPAFEHQEVIVHTPRHVGTLAELDDDELDAIAVAWHERLGAARQAGFDYPFLLFNEGREAGASLPHTHSQIVWLREAPPEVQNELPRLASGACALCEVLADDTLEVAVDGELSLRAAPAGRAPYEALIAPRAHEAGPDLEALGSAARLLRLTVSRLRDLEGPAPLNAWLHQGAHWHFEVVPRLPVLAGLELGGGIFVNWLAPEEAAARLRS
jgi:UDPglucose--hexose-1-phosphate uridylyltransferase